jgi:hypothetical protein
MVNQEIITNLLENACPSIRCRVRVEILRQSFDDEQVNVLQNKILQDNLVREAISWQGSDDWKSSQFHGSNGIEAGVRILCEKGVRKDRPDIRKALNSLRENPDIIYRGIGKPGRILDELGLGGSQMIKAVVFAYAGAEHEPCVAKQVRIALEGLASILTYESIDDITVKYKNDLIFKPAVMWPSIYHLRLLANTKQWRTPDNYRLVSAGIKKLVELSPIPPIKVLKKSQLIAPASFAMQDFTPDMENMDGAMWMLWFHRTELLSRIGIIDSIEELRKQIMRFSAILQQGNGWFVDKIFHRSFMNWGAYTGLCLEKDWRSAKRRIYDLTFRSLIIRHNFQ